MDLDIRGLTTSKAACSLCFSGAKEGEPVLCWGKEIWGNMDGKQDTL